MNRKKHNLTFSHFKIFNFLRLNKSVVHLFTKGSQVDAEGEAVASRLFVPLAFGKIKAESQQRHRHERRELLQFGRLNHDKDRGHIETCFIKGSPIGRARSNGRSQSERW